jgi:hypothetical protein
MNESDINGCFDLIRSAPLLERADGTLGIKVGLIDGPVVIDDPDLAAGNIREVPGESAGTCAPPTSAACEHGTFVAGILEILSTVRGTRPSNRAAIVTTAAGRVVDSSVHAQQRIYRKQ